MKNDGNGPDKEKSKAAKARDMTAEKRKKAAEYLATLKQGRQLVFINKLRERLHDNSLEAVAASIDSANGLRRQHRSGTGSKNAAAPHLIAIRKLSEIRGTKFTDSKLQTQWTDELDVSFNLSELLYLDTYFHERKIMDLATEPFIRRPVNLIDCLIEKEEVTFLLSSQGLNNRKNSRDIKYISHYDAECFSHLSKEKNVAAHSNRFSYYDDRADTLLDDVRAKPGAYVACGAPHVSSVTRILFEEYFNKGRHSAYNSGFPFAFYYQGLKRRPPKTTQLYLDAVSVEPFMAAKTLSKADRRKLRALINKERSNKDAVKQPNDSRVLFIDDEIFFGQRDKQGYGIVCATRTESNSPVVAMLGDFGTTTAELGRALAERSIEEALPQRVANDPQKMMVAVFQVSEQVSHKHIAKLVYGPSMYKLSEGGWSLDKEKNSQ
jgi:hypothetical protein